MLRYVFFDLDGVVVDSEMLHFECWQQVLDKLGRQLYSLDYKSMLGRMTPDIAAEFKTKFSLDLSVKELGSLKRKLFYELLPNVKTNAYLYDLLEYLRLLGISTALVTSARKEIVQQILANNDLGKSFEFVIAREDVVLNKPHPLPYLRALQLADVYPSETLAIEDSITGFNSANAANIDCVLYGHEVMPVGVSSSPLFVTNNLEDIKIYLQSLCFSSTY